MFSSYLSVMIIVIQIVDFYFKMVRCPAICLPYKISSDQINFDKTRGFQIFPLIYISALSSRQNPLNLAAFVFTVEYFIIMVLFTSSRQATRINNKNLEGFIFQKDSKERTIYVYTY